MPQLRPVLFIAFLLAGLTCVSGCIERKNKVELKSEEYDLNKPLTLILNDALAEISGIYFYPKDTSVFAISDDETYLFKIHINSNTTRKWRFGDNLDYEDITFYDSTFYVLESNGIIHSLAFSADGDTIYTTQSELTGQEDLEFESLYYEEQIQQLVLICKDCDDDKKAFTTAWGYDPVAKKYDRSLFTIDVNEIAKRAGHKKIKFKPSAATINPQTGDVWIVSAINQLIAVTDRQGKVKKVYTLDPRIFTQPEGIAFTPWGDLIIADEAGDNYGKGNLLIFKKKNYQK